MPCPSQQWRDQISQGSGVNIKEVANLANPSSRRNLSSFPFQLQDCCRLADRIDILLDIIYLNVRQTEWLCNKVFLTCTYEYVVVITNLELAPLEVRQRLLPCFAFGQGRSSLGSAHCRAKFCAGSPVLSSSDWQRPPWESKRINWVFRVLY